MRSLLENKKGQAVTYGPGALGTLAIILVVAAIIIAIGGEIVSDVGDEVAIEDGADQQYLCGTNGSAAFNATCGGEDAVETFGDWLDTIALIIVAAIVIGIIVSSFGRVR